MATKAAAKATPAPQEETGDAGTASVAVLEGHAHVSQETSSIESEAQKLTDSNIEDIEAAGVAADAALIEAGVETTNETQTREERTAYFRAQSAALARHRRQIGITMMRDTSRFRNVMSLDVELNLVNYSVFSPFAQFFPRVDDALHLLGISGGFLLGEDISTQLSDQITDSIDKFSESMASLYGRVKLVGDQGRISLGEKALAPSVTEPAFQRTVKVKTRASYLLLEAFQNLDSAISEMHFLKWNNMSGQEDIDHELAQVRKSIFSLFVLSARTSSRINQHARAYRKVARTERQKFAAAH